MKKSRFSEEQITYALRQADSGTPVADICRQLGVSEASFYYWRKKFGTLGISGMRERVRQLAGELLVIRSEPGTLVEATIPLFG